MAWHTRAQRTTIKCRRLAVCVAIPPEATFSLPLRLRLPFGFHLRADRISQISAEREGRSSSRSIVGISSGTGKWDEAYSISIPRFPSRSSQAGASTGKGSGSLDTHHAARARPQHSHVACFQDPSPHHICAWRPAVRCLERPVAIQLEPP